MDSFDDLERQRAQQLRPDRIHGVDETRRRIAPHLEGVRNWSLWRLAPAWTVALILVAVTVAAVLLLLRVPSGDWPVTAVSGQGGTGMHVVATQPMATTVSTIDVTHTTSMTLPGVGSPTAKSGMIEIRSDVTNLEPPPSFQVLQPTYLPSGMRLVALVYAPGLSGEVQKLPVVAASNSRFDGEDLDSAVATDAQQRAQLLVGDGREATLVLVYAAGPNQFMELVQRPVRERELPAGDPAVARNARASFVERDGHGVLSWIDIASPASQSSFIEVYTTLGRAEAQRVGDGLRNTLLPGQGTPAPRPTNRAATPPSLSQWPKRVIAPKAAREAIARSCGPWPAATALQTSDLSAENREQMVCVARLVSGFDGSDAAVTRAVRGGYNVGISRFSWVETAARYGLNPTSGSAGDPAVWVVSLAVSEQGGSVVVLDTMTGEPIVLMELEPLR